MEWRRIDVHPSVRSGKLYTRVHGHSLIFGVPLYSRDDYDPAYTESDVLTFFFNKQNEAVTSGICTEEEFQRFNASFLNKVKEMDNWPIPSCSCLGDMYIPIPDEQLKYEKIKPLLDTGIFPHLDLDTQLLVWEFVDVGIRKKLLEQLTEEQQKDLCTAIATSNK